MAKKKRTPKKQWSFSLELDNWEALVRADNPGNEAEAAKRDRELAKIAELRPTAAASDAEELRRTASDAEELRRMEAWTAVDWFEDTRRDRQPIGWLFEQRQPGDPDPRSIDELMLGELRELNSATLEMAGFTPEAIADSDAVLEEFEQLFADCRRPDGFMDLAQITARCWLRWRIPEERLPGLTPERIVMMDRESRAAESAPPTRDWATRLKALRERKNWSQDDAWRELKTTKTTIQNIESGATRKPRGDIRKAIEKHERES